jgi:hypothetical protein
MEGENSLQAANNHPASILTVQLVAEQRSVVLGGHVISRHHADKFNTIKFIRYTSKECLSML